MNHEFITIGNRSYTATHLMGTRKRLAYDTNENRFIRWMLECIHGKLTPRDLRRSLRMDGTSLPFCRISCNP
ncbi:DUF2357 domain-containing protein [Paenibacillus camerounensis]|uniref:DUF2357 domain-containing protein n=1 Tax=Paenibacillus camerounensis TaxID=1243663 RepID=UPI0012F85D37